MNKNTMLDLGADTALIAAAFFVRNAAVLFTLSALAVIVLLDY
jgi:hypothetical protein